MWDWLLKLLGLPQELPPDIQARYDVQRGKFISGDPRMYEPPPSPTPGIPQELLDAGWYPRGQSPTPTPSPTTTQNQFGIGTEEAYVNPELYDAILALEAIEKEKRNLLELSGQESSYGYAGPHISDVEESYGPFHINLKAGRVDPTTGQPFTREGAEDINRVVEYALEEMRRTGGLGAWNPGAYDFYQEGLPKRAETKLYKRGQ